MTAASHSRRGLQPTQKLLKAVALKKNNKRAARRVLVFFEQNSQTAAATPGTCATGQQADSSPAGLRD